MLHTVVPVHTLVCYIRLKHTVCYIPPHKKPYNTLYHTLDDKYKISKLVEGINFCPMNIPLWVKLSKYPIVPSDIPQVTTSTGTKRDILKTFFNSFPLSFILTNDTKMQNDLKTRICADMDDQFFSK